MKPRLDDVARWLDEASNSGADADDIRNCAKHVRRWALAVAAMGLMADASREEPYNAVHWNRLAGAAEAAYRTARDGDE